MIAKDRWKVITLPNAIPLSGFLGFSISESNTFQWRCSMQHITLQIQDRDFAVISKVALVEDKAIETMTVEALKQYCACSIETPLAELGIHFDT